MGMQGLGRTMRYLWLGTSLLALSACAGMGSLTQGTQDKKAVQAPEKVIVDLAHIQHAFASGKVMKAYAWAKEIKPKDADYAKSQQFLKQVINPARLRLLRHYKMVAKGAERHKQWHKALLHYQQAAEFSAKPEVFDSNIQSMQRHIQQSRLDTLLQQRRLEDHAWLQGIRAYTLSKNIGEHDAILSEFSIKFHQQLDQRIEQAYTDAAAYWKQGKRIPAYVLAESHLRLLPDSARGEALMAHIYQDWPAWLKTSKKVSVAKREKVRKPVVPVPEKPVEVVLSQEEILALLKQKQWSKAQDAVTTYRKHQGESAEGFFKEVETQLHAEAEKLFQAGSLAFRHEHIDQSVSLWDKAVDLDPQNESYLDALQRAMVLQDRLHLLRKDKK